jgi:hypothetical protein
MRVTGKFFPTSVGLCFIAFALIVAVLLLPGAKGSQSPFLYVCILGGLFVGIPTALGIGVVVENFASEGEFVPRTSHLHEVNERSHLVTTVITCKGAQPLRSEGIADSWWGSKPRIHKSVIHNAAYPPPECGLRDHGRARSLKQYL